MRSYAGLLDRLTAKVELKPLAQLLEDMLYEAGDEGLEVCLAEAVTDASQDVLAVEREYRERYARAVQAITEHRGAPSFSGARGQPGCPEWLQLEAASCWSDVAGVIFVGLKHDDRGPRLLGGGRPHPVRREAITILPSAG
jgi:hypothetical protein